MLFIEHPQLMASPHEVETGSWHSEEAGDKGPRREDYGIPIGEGLSSI
jgi:hypothetical protein